MDNSNASNISCRSNDNNNNNNNNDDDEGNSGDEMSSDAEGVWSVDIEQSFHEALAIYPPCGRRKIILSDEGKMYGRNELIARYIKLRTGKMRSRKQVSSHIQVMARRKSKEIQAQLKDQASKDRALQALSSLSSAQIVSASTVHNNNKGLHAGLTPILYPHMSQLGPTYPPYGSSSMPLWGTGPIAQDMKVPYGGSVYCVDKPSLSMVGDIHQAWQGRSIAGPQLRLVEFSAFLEHGFSGMDPYNSHLFVHIGSSISYSDPLLEAVDIRQISDKFPEKRGGLKDLFDKGPQASFFLVKFWADLNVNIQNTAGRFYGVSTLFESHVEMIIQCSTKVCSFGKQVVEKVETEFARCENGRYTYRTRNSPMCEYMVNFIRKLKQLPEKYMMNSVLENFTILQVVINKDTQETLLCVAYVFEVSASELGAQHHIYRLVRD